MSYINQYKEQIAALCDKHNVEQLYIFGSALKNTMTKDSDVDLLVKFKKFNLAKYFQNYMEFKTSLQNLFKRKVDLVEEQTLSNPYLIKSIDRNKELIYG
jgi:predicted nucleotidyltransferase